MEKDVQYSLRFSREQDRIVKLYQKVCGYESVSHMIKQVVLEKIKKVPAKIEIYIKRVERKIEKIEKKIGSKSEAIKDREYKKLLTVLDDLARSKEVYETLIYDFFPKPDPIKCILEGFETYSSQTQVKPITI